MKKENIKEKIKEILTEMMATSPSRDWSFEAHSTAKEIANRRKENENHISMFAEEILELLKIQINEK